MFVRRLLTLLSFVPFAFAHAQSTAQADSLFQKSDWRAAAPAYAAVTQREPTNGLAWFRLGVARHALGEYDAAIPAYEKARDLRFQAASAEFRLARVYSLKRDAERAVQALERAIAAGLNNPTQPMSEPDLANVREHPKFKVAIKNLEARRYPCRAGAPQQQLDFWIGTWDVYLWTPPAGGNPVVGTNDIEAILEHCVLLENWTAGAGGKGKSFNFYDTNVGKWRQIWMGDGGGSLDYTGEFRDGAMRFEGWTLGPNGRKVLQKLTFFPIARDTVRQLFETSNDSGKAWQPGFDARYVRKKPSS